MTITSSDVPRVAATIRVAGELFEVHGDLMLHLTEDWRAGAKAANLDPSTRGNQWDADNECHVPNDPTGEAAAMAARADLAAELQVRLERIVLDAQWLRDTAHVLAPIVPPSTMNEKNDLWCQHHLRIGVCEVRHRNTDCRKCDDFLKLWQVRPPVAILRDWHQGKRVSEQRVKDALAEEGVILETVKGVTKAVRQARSPRTPNQNQKRRKAS